MIMKNEICLLLVVECLFIFSMKFNYIDTDFTLSNPNKPQEILTQNGEIANPLRLEYEFYKISKSEDGTPLNAYIEKGKKDNDSGDYVWTKGVPIYASSELKYIFEYQMNFTDGDLKALIKWLQENMGEDVKGGSIDKPDWYRHDMPLSEIYKYCKMNNQNITMGYFNETLKRGVILVFDSGSQKTKTSAEIGLVYMIYK